MKQSNKFLLNLFILFLGVLVANITTHHFLSKNTYTTKSKDVTLKLANIRAHIEEVISTNFALIYGTAAYIETNPDITDEQFKEYTQKIFKNKHDLLNIAAAPDLIITFVYPMEGNESILGIDYNKIPSQKDKALEAKNSGKMILAGPLKLIQGGNGLVARVPVFYNDNGKKVFWGLVSSAINLDSVFNEVERMSAKFGINVVMTKIADDSDKHIIFYGLPSLLETPDKNVKMQIKVPGSSWELVSAPIGGWSNLNQHSTLVNSVSVLIFLISSLLLFLKHVTESKLVESEQRFKDLTQISSDWVWEVDIYGKYTFASGKVKEILGYEPEEILGKSPFDFMLPNDSEKISSKFIELVQERKPLIDVENWNYTKDGRLICLLTSGTPIFGANGKLLGYRGVDKDITQSKESENSLIEAREHMQEVVEATSDAFFETDNNFKISYMNHGAELQFGVKLQDLDNDTLWSILPSSLSYELRPVYESALSTNTPVQTEAYSAEENKWYEFHIYSGKNTVSTYSHDITKRKLLEQDLKVANTELDTIFNVTRDGIAITDLETNFLHCNNAYLKMIGYSMDEMRKLSCIDLSAVEDIPISKKVVEQVIRDGFVEKFEKTCIAKDGSRVMVQMSIVLLPDNERLLLTTRDVTDLNKIQTKLKRNEERLRAIFEASPVAMILQDITGKINYANKRFSELFGYSHTEIKSLGNWFSHIDYNNSNPELYDWAEKTVSALEKGSKLKKIQASINCNDGSKKEVILLFRAIGNEGLVVFKDITDIYLYEQELEKYIDIVDKNVITSRTDTRGFITHASEAFCEISEFTKDELIGKNHNIVKHPDTPQEVFEDMWQTITRGETWHGEIKNLKKNGGFYWVDTTIDPMYDDKGIINGYMAVRQDITSKKEIEKISVTDRLTGIYNRVKLDEILDYHFSSHKRYKTIFSLILFDIDKFKSVNDTFGHLAGDSVLKEISCLITQNIRKVDIFGRWGGEEFLIVCPSTDICGAAQLGEHLRKLIEKFDFAEVGRVTCSFGVADCIDQNKVDEIISTADKRLYVAKNNGRNQVVSDSTSCDLTNYL